MYLSPTNGTLTVVKMVHFMFCIFHRNQKGRNKNVSITNNNRLAFRDPLRGALTQVLALGGGTEVDEASCGRFGARDGYMNRDQSASL